jgi:lipopolysaccharide export system protein LptA
MLSIGALCHALPLYKKQAIKISADSAERDEKSATTRYSGNVLIAQGSLKISAHEVTIVNSGDSVTHITAHGSPATFEQQPRSDAAPVTASANEIVYQIQDAQIHLQGRAKIFQAGRSVSGENIDYYIDQQRFTANSQNSNGQNADNASENGEHQPRSRVEVIISVD